MYRQGDVLLKKINELPKNLTEKDKILAYGEATGHKHQFVSPTVTVLTDGTTQFCVVEEESVLEHEEHENIQIPAGIYEVVPQVEFDLLEGVRQVMD